MVEKTIELTDNQLEKVQFLEERGLSVGDAVEMLFKIKEDIEAHKKEIHEGVEQFVKLNDENHIKFAEKNAVSEEDAESHQTYDKKIQAVKRNISWTDDFLNF